MEYSVEAYFLSVTFPPFIYDLKWAVKIFFDTNGKTYQHRNKV